jgi:hypothetical protein
VDAFEGRDVRRVLLQTVTGDTCATADEDGEVALAQDLTLARRAHVIVSFTFEWGSLAAGEEGLISLTAGSQSSAEWGFAGVVSTRTSSTITWAFADVPRGPLTVAAQGRVEGGDTSAELNDCGLIVTILERE